MDLTIQYCVFPKVHSNSADICHALKMVEKYNKIEEMLLSKAEIVLIII